jgi:hypothetical protein
MVSISRTYWLWLFCIDSRSYLWHTGAVLRWVRCFPDSANNFDLRLVNPQELDAEQMNALLESILKETHRGLTLSSRAVKEFRRWFSQPDTPLKSDAFVLLSNWFMTQSGDRLSMVATRCETLWDALFPCRPAERLSSPEPGRNHVIVLAEFARFWQRFPEAQGKGGEADQAPLEPAGPDSDRLRATFDKSGLHCEVEGSPRALASFLKMVSGWEAT